MIAYERWRPTHWSLLMYYQSCFPARFIGEIKGRMKHPHFVRMSNEFICWILVYVIFIQSMIMLNGRKLLRKINLTVRLRFKVAKEKHISFATLNLQINLWKWQLYDNLWLDASRTILPRAILNSNLFQKALAYNIRFKWGLLSVLLEIYIFKSIAKLYIYVYGFPITEQFASLHFEIATKSKRSCVPFTMGWIGWVV